MKKILIILLALIATLFISGTVRAADPVEYDIVFNPTGTHFSDDTLIGDPNHLETKGQLKIRLDFYPKEGTKAFEQQYVYMPIEPIPPYPGKVDEFGSPIDLKEYEAWYDSLPKEWRLNPALCLFVKIDSLTTVADLETYILTCLLYTSPSPRDRS